MKGEWMESVFKKLMYYQQKMQLSLSGYPILLCLMLVILGSLLEMRLVLWAYGDHLNHMAVFTQNVLNGTPETRVFQNRILGPILVHLISSITGWTFALSYKIFIIPAIILTNITAFFVFLDLTRDKAVSLQYVLYFGVCFLLFQDGFLLFTWDFLDVFIFLLFAYGVAKRSGIVFFTTLYFVSLLNKENALLIGLWLAIDSFSYLQGPFKDVSGGKLKTNYPKLLFSVFLTVVGIFFTQRMRNFLFVTSSDPQKGLDLGHIGMPQDIRIITNSIYLTQFECLASLDFIVLVVAMSSLVYVLLKIRFDERCIKAVTLFVCLFLTIGTFARFEESRIFFILIPFVLMLSLEFSNRIVGRHP